MVFSKGNIPWTKGLTKETDKRIKQFAEKISKTRIEKGLAKGKNNPMYGKKRPDFAEYCRTHIRRGKDHPTFIDGRKLKKNYCIDCGKKLVEYTAKRCRKCNGKFLSGQNSPMYGRKGQKHHSYGKTGYWANKKRPEMSGGNNPMYGKPTHLSKGAYYKGIWMRSSWEIRIAQLLDKIRIPWQYELKRFYFENCSYCPDFYLPKWNLWIEVKGWMRPEGKKRIDLFQRHYPKENLLVINKKLYKKYCEARLAREYEGKL